MKSKIATVNYRRKRAVQTDYHKRLTLLTSKQARLVIRKSLHHMYASVVGYEGKGDKILASASTAQLAKLGWKHGTSNVPAAYLVGYALGVACKQKKISKAIVDLGFQKSVKGSRIYAVVAGALAAGLEVPCDESMLPSEDRLTGNHVGAYATGEGGKSEFQFKSISKHTKPDQIRADVEALKKKIGN